MDSEKQIIREIVKAVEVGANGKTDNLCDGTLTQ